VTWDDQEWWHDWAEPSERRKDRPRCGAKTRAGGSCLVRIEPGKARCRFHGGLSTGPNATQHVMAAVQLTPFRLRDRSLMVCRVPPKVE